jgi:hypothetical protein
MRKRFLVTAGTVLVVLIATAVLLIYRSRQDPFEAKYRSIRLGMTRQDVQAIMGQPDWSFSGDKYSHDRFEDSRTEARVMVDYDSWGKVEGKDLYPAQRQTIWDPLLAILMRLFPPANPSTHAY